MLPLGPPLKPNEAGAHLFRVKGELENILRSVKEWKASGVDGNGVVPIAAISLEKQLEAALESVSHMINLVSQVKFNKKKNK